jgi:hypothetical protein
MRRAGKHSSSMMPQSRSNPNSLFGRRKTQLQNLPNKILLMWMKAHTIPVAVQASGTYKLTANEINNVIWFTVILTMVQPKPLQNTFYLSHADYNVEAIQQSSHNVLVFQSQAETFFDYKFHLQSHQD